MTSPCVEFGCCNSKDDNYILCNSCDAAYHRTCVSNFTTDPGNSWVCSHCTNNVDIVQAASSGGDATHMSKNTRHKRPPKRLAINSPPDCVEDNPVTREDVRHIIKDVFDEKMDAFFNRIESRMRNIINEELAPIKEELQEVQKFTTFVNVEFEEMKKRQDQSSDTLKSLQKENSTLLASVNDLKSRINQMEQTARSNNIEIQCLPERKDENIMRIISCIAKTIGFDLTEDKIVNCSRIAKLNRDNPRPRSVVAQFSSQSVRDHFLAATIKYNKANPNDKLNTASAGVSTPGNNKSPIFVMEHLSPANKQLHAAARQKAKELGYAYVWVRNGRIYMTKNDTSDFKLIRDLDSLNKL